MSNPYFLSFEEIVDQLVSFLPPSWRSQFSGKVLKRLIVAYAVATEALYALLARLLRLSIIATSEREWLRALVAGMAMDTFGGTPASVLVRFERFTTTETIVIPQGTQVGAVGGQQFETLLPATLEPGQTAIDVSCIALEPGVAGNIGRGEIVSLITPAPGIDRVGNAFEASGGFDAEADSEIKARLPRHLESLHRATIPATEYAIAIDRERFPEVTAFLTQRNFGTPGYFRGILSDTTGGDAYRAIQWTPVGSQGVYWIPTALSEINGLVSAGFPCRRFGIVKRSIDGEEIWVASNFVVEVEQGDWRFCHDRSLGRLYARADGRDLNTLDLTIYAGVFWRALRELELSWAANGVFCDVLVPFLVSGNISLTYTLEPDYLQQDVEAALRSALTEYSRSLRLGESLQLENLYAVLNRVAGAAGVIVVSPVGNVTVPSDHIFRLSAVAIDRRAN